MVPTIAAIGTAVPPYPVSQDTVRNVARSFFAGRYKDVDRLLRVFAHAHIETRHFCMPVAWFQEEHSFEEKNALYSQYAVELGSQAATACLAAAGCRADEVDHIVFVSTTGLATPSIDVHIANRLNMSPHVRRTPIWGLGCAGGAAGLSHSMDLALAHPQKRVLLITVELCSLTFLRQNLSKSNLVATSLFADGAAAVLIEGDALHPGEGRLRLVDAMSTQWRDTTDVMGWKVTDAGLEVIFSRDIPSLVTSRMRTEVERFVRKCGVSLPAISRFVAHPGGAKVLRAYEKALDLHSASLVESRDVLRQFGNMSSSTVLFVLQAVNRRPSPRGAYGLLFALGPGFSCEQVLLRWG
jgi:alkylresorcinol/alkylpyrone synthase